MNILIANRRGKVRDSFLTKPAMEKIYTLGNVVENPYEREYTPEELRENLKDVDVVLSGWGTAPLTSDVLSKANKLKLHVHVGGSVAAYISPEEFQRGVTVLSGNEIFAYSVAEGCLCYILTALRRVPKYLQITKDNGWKSDSDLFFEGLLYKKVGIVGYGAIAKYICRLLKPFQVKLYIYSSHHVEEEGATMASLDEIFENCDIISLHNAWNKQTEGMIKKEHLAKIKDGALFVNTARAPIVDEEAMLEEFSKERFNAVLDVYHQEPLSMESPLRRMKNVMLFPHMAGPTMDMREQVGIALAEDIESFINGKPCKNVVTAEQASRMTIEKR